MTFAWGRADDLPVPVGTDAVNNAPTLLALSPLDLPATDAVAIVASLALILAPRRRDERGVPDPHALHRTD